MAALERPDPALVPPHPTPHPTPIRDARREGKPGQLVPPYELALADFARHLSLSARRRLPGHPAAADRLGAGSAAGRALRAGALPGSRPAGAVGDWEGPLSTSTQTVELAGLRRFFRWARAEVLRLDDPTEGIRPPRREPYARAPGLSAEEVARLLAAIPVESPAGLRLRAPGPGLPAHRPPAQRAAQPALAGPGPGGWLLPLQRRGHAPSPRTSIPQAAAGSTAALISATPPANVFVSGWRISSAG
jgi:hypothetical protein